MGFALIFVCGYRCIYRFAVGRDGFGFSLGFGLRFGSEWWWVLVCLRGLWWWVLVFCWVCSGGSVVFCKGCGLVGDVGR